MTAAAQCRDASARPASCSCSANTRVLDGGHRGASPPSIARAVGHFVAGADARRRRWSPKVVESRARAPGRSGGDAARRAPRRSTARRRRARRDKLGLGSSAAAAAAGVGAMLEAAGLRSSSSARRCVFALADARAPRGAGRAAARARTWPPRSTAASSQLQRPARRRARRAPLAAPARLSSSSCSRPARRARPSTDLRARRGVRGARSPGRTRGACGELRATADALPARLRGRTTPRGRRRRGRAYGRRSPRSGADVGMPIVTPAARGGGRRWPRSWAAPPSPRARAAATSASRFLTDPGPRRPFAQRAPHIGLEILSISDRRERPAPRAVSPRKESCRTVAHASRVSTDSPWPSGAGCCACTRTCRSRTCATLDGGGIDTGGRRSGGRERRRRLRAAARARAELRRQRPRLPGADGGRGAVGDRGRVERGAHGARGRRLRRRRGRSGDDRADRDRRRRRSGRRPQARRGGQRRAAGAGARDRCRAWPIAAAARASWRCAPHPRPRRSCTCTSTAATRWAPTWSTPSPRRWPSGWRGWRAGGPACAS